MDSKWELKRTAAYSLFPEWGFWASSKILIFNVEIIIGHGADLGLLAVSLQAAGDLVINPAVVHHYLPPGQQLLSQPKSITVLWSMVDTKLYCLVTEAHRCK